MRCHKHRLKNCNFFQKGQRTGTDPRVTCHTGIEREGKCTCNPFSLLSVEGDRVNPMPCPILTVQGVEVELKPTRVNQKVKAIFKLRGNRDTEELARCAVLTVPVEEFSHVQYSALPSVEWQQRGRNMDAPL